MNNFQQLENKTLEETPLPLGIQSNVRGRLGNMRTFGDVIDLYMSRILDILTSMFGGDTNATGNSHMITLFVPTIAQDLNEAQFLANLKNAFHLSKRPTLLCVVPATDGIEVSIKMPNRDASKIKKSSNAPLLEEFHLELR